MSMPYDFKKEMKELYAPKNKPEIVTVPKMNYVSAPSKTSPEKLRTVLRHLIKGV